MTRYAKIKKKYESAEGFNVIPLIPERDKNFKASENEAGSQNKKTLDGKQELADNRKDLLTNSRKRKSTEEREKIVTAKSRSEKRRLKRIKARQNKITCFGCRKIGHGVINCPLAKEKGVGVCYNCGSSEHTTKDCKKPLKQEDKYQYAKCFVCGEQGHLSGKCPKNEKGLYPKGGAYLGTALVGKIDLHHGADDDDFHIFVKEKEDFKKERDLLSANNNLKLKKKIVNFL